MNGTDFQLALVAIQAEFVEMPGVRLTLPQVSRLCEIPAAVCRTAVGTLVATGFLAETDDRTYLWRGTSPVSVKPLDSLTWVVGPGVA
jgi:DNA-binding IclR family transcriptional regulator